MKRSEFGKLLNLEVDLIPKGKRNRPGHVNEPRYITIHNTANKRAKATADAHNNFLKRNGFYRHRGRKNWVSWHYTVDDHKVIKHLPINEVGYHSKSGNIKSIGIEICMYRGIDQEKANLRAARLVAALLYDVADLNRNVYQVVPHQRWTGKNCPVLLLDNGKPRQKWHAFLALIQSELEGIV